MAPFTPEQEDYISTSIRMAMETAMSKIDGVLGEVKNEHDAMKSYIEAHQNELAQNSERVSK